MTQATRFQRHPPVQAGLHAPVRRRGFGAAAGTAGPGVISSSSSLMALPNLVLIVAFTYRPLISNIYYSTLDWTLGSASATVVGFRTTSPSSPATTPPKVLGTTAVFTLATVGGSCCWAC